MNKKDKNKKSGSFDLMQDTQYLLMGLEDVEYQSYALEDILAEFGSEDPSGSEPEVHTSVELPVQPVPQPEPENDPLADTMQIPNNMIAFPTEAAAGNDGDDTMVLIDMRDYDEDPSAEDLFGLTQTEKPEPVEKRNGKKSTAQIRESAAPPKPPTMEDIVASTVDAVIADQERKNLHRTRHIRKEQKRLQKKHREPRTDLPLNEEIPDPPVKETAAFHKRRAQESRRALLFAVPILVIVWLPWLFMQLGLAIPYFSNSEESAALCMLIAHILLGVLCLGVFRAAAEELRERQCTYFTYAALTNLAAVVDAATAPLLPHREALSPLSAVAGTALVFALWGLSGYHRGMWETLRTVAMGEPACAADRHAAGVIKGNRRREGFIARLNTESTAAQWQRLMLPVLLAACAVFAVLASAGQDNWHDLPRCLSVMLCASCSLVCPMAYCVPWGRIARRLSRNGTALAGQYGAAALAAERKIVVTDTDLFPRSSVTIDGIKLFGEDRDQAVSYTATLAVQAGGCMGRVFEEVCRSERIRFQSLEHFHVHDDNGLSGMIRGETVLVGTPMFMRHKAVRLPSRLPAKNALCLAVDGELTAIFSIKYQPSAATGTALRALGRNHIQLVLATRDGNITPKRLKQYFGTDGKALLPEISERLSLSDPEREAAAPSGLIYRDGLLPFTELTVLSHRLCQTIKTGNLLSMIGSTCGALLGFYMTFVGRSDALSPGMLLIYLLLWTVPMLPLLSGADKM